MFSFFSVSSLSNQRNITAFFSLLPCDILTQINSILTHSTHVGIILDHDCPAISDSLPTWKIKQLLADPSEREADKPLYLQPLIHPYQALKHVIESQGWQKLILLYDEDPCMYIEKHVYFKRDNRMMIFLN